MLARPILWREILDLSRRRRLWVYQVAYAAVLGMVFLLLWPRGGRLNPVILQQSGTTFMTWVLWIQITVLVIMIPPLVAASIAIEREQGSLDLLLLSPIGAGSIVATKCFTQLFNFGLIFLSGVPIFMMGLFLGGIAPEQLYLGLAMLGGIGLLAGSAGALSGAMFHSVYAAILGGYVLLGILFGVMPLVLSRFWPPAWVLLSPFGMVRAVLGAAPTLPGSNLGPGLILGGWLGMSAALMYFGKRRLVKGTVRRSGRAGRSGRKKDERHEGRERTLKVHESNLLVWREMRGKKTDCTWVPLVLVVTLYTVVVGLDLLLWKSIQDPMTNFAASLGLGLGVLAFALMVSTASMVRERREGDLDLLLLTELDSREIIRGKYRGVMLTLRPIFLLPVLQSVLGGWPLAPLTVVVVLLILFSLVPATLLAGIESGMRNADLRAALGRSVQRWAALVLGISAKMVFILLVPILVNITFPIFGIPLLLFVYPLVRYSNDYLLGPVMDDMLSSQFSQGGMDTEWHGEEWEIGHLEKMLAGALWLFIAIFISIHSGRLIGIFVLFILGTGAAIGGLLCTIWFIKRIQGKMEPPPEVEEAVVFFDEP